MPPRHGGSPGAIPGSRTTLFHRLRVSTRPSLQNSAHSGQHGGSLPISGSWQTSNALALQASSCGSVTRRLHQFHCGENEIQASLISSASVGATPTPATNLGRCSGCPTVNRASQNTCRKRRSGALPAPPTSLRPLHGGGRRLPRRSTKCEDGHFVGLRGFGLAGHFRIRSSISGAARCLREG